MHTFCTKKGGVSIRSQSSCFEGYIPKRYRGIDRFIGNTEGKAHHIGSCLSREKAPNHELTFYDLGTRP